MSLASPDLKVVYRKTFSARTQWRNILLELGLNIATIDSIGVRWRDNPDDCYREGLSEWLKGGERNWRDLVEALSSPTVGHEDIARGVVKKNCPKALATNPHHHVVNDDLVIYTKENLGVGSFGSVFKGSYKSEPCAIKLLHFVAIQMHTKLSFGPGMGAAVVAFDRECDFIRSFQHPNIVMHLSSEKHPVSGNTMLITELMDCTLRSYICQASHGSHFDLSLSKDVASGLAYIHSRRIIHRDLCGDNVLLRFSQGEPVAKISDFGMSRLLDSSKFSSTLTAVGHRLGYMPPEALRIEEEQYDHSLDVFSLGAVMVQIVCKLETVKSAKDRLHHAGQIPDTHALKPLITKCLQSDSKNRPQAQDVCVALERLTKEDRASDSCSSQKIPPTKSETRVATQLVDRVSRPTTILPLNLDFQPGMGMTPPLNTPTLEWRIGKNMPIRMGYTIQSVVIGNAVYVGGGSSKTDLDRRTILKLDLHRDEWTKLPLYVAKWFAMTSYASNLLLIGGKNLVTNQRSNQIAVFESNMWIYAYPPMKIARSSSTAVCFHNFIIVAGGYDNERKATATVEVLNMSSRNWFFFEPLPQPRLFPRSVLMGSSFYLMGGLDDTGSPTKTVHKVDLDRLIDFKADDKTSSNLWQVVKQDAPLMHCTPLSTGGRLLTIGGWNGRPEPAIHFYRPDVMKWVKVGDLPKAKWNCTCSVLPNGQVIIAGGTAGSYISDVEFLSIT